MIEDFDKSKLYKKINHGIKHIKSYLPNKNWLFKFFGLFTLVNEIILFINY